MTDEERTKDFNDLHDQNLVNEAKTTESRRSTKVMDVIKALLLGLFINRIYGTPNMVCYSEVTRKRIFSNINDRVYRYRSSYRQVPSCNNYWGANEWVPLHMCLCIVSVHTSLFWLVFC